MKPVSYKILSVLFLLPAAGCTKWVSVPPPVTQVTAAGVFANDATAEAAVTGVYSQVMQGSLSFLNGGTTLYPALSADELYNTLPDGTTDPFTANALAPQNSVVGFNLWGRAYSYLYQINACLEGIASSSSISGGMKNRLTGEMLFMRGLSYFYLVNLFGEVPLELTTDYARNEALPRTDTSLVYAQVMSDLSGAEMLLKEADMGTDNTRPSLMACMALKARVFLYQKQWESAIAQADTVIESGAYQLETLDSVFTAPSRETIFSLVPVIPGVNTSEALSFIPYDRSVVPQYALTQWLLSAFETDDARKTAWLDSTENNGQVYYYPLKYKVRGSDATEEHNGVLRLAELYLVRAEAKAELGDLMGAAADVNKIRQRAGLPPLPEGLSQAHMLARIGAENQVEFFAEWGHRWLDLKRTGEANTILGTEKRGWKPAAVRYPIPYGEILLNGSLTQNEGY